MSGSDSINEVDAERLRVKRELSESETRLHDFIEASTQGLAVFDGELTFVECNSVCARMFGATPEALIGRKLAEVSPDAENTGRLAMYRRVVETGEPLELLEVIPHPQFGDLRLNLRVFKVGAGAGIIATDVTEQARARQKLARLEEQLRQSAKMEAVGRLAGGVAHDFNNLLTGISGYAELLLQEFSRADPLYADLEEILKASNRAADLTSQLLAFSRKQIIQPRVIGPNEVLNRSRRMLARIIGEDVRLGFEPAADLWNIRLDPSQLDQVLVNLGVNARDAMPDGGRLLVETANVPAGTAEGSRVAPEAGDLVLLAISDTGHGMDLETREHMFEPFFSTKGKEKGTGLGLSTVYGIVCQNNGHIYVESEPGRGTRIEIYFPAEKCAVTADRSGLGRLAAGGGETILLAEDEAVVRRISQRFLKDLGYRVLDASSGSEALDIAQHHDGEIHLLLTDVVMLSMNGKELYEQLHQIRPEVRVLYMSGYPDEAIASHGVLEESTDFLPKPFTCDILGRAVLCVLGR